MTADSRALVLFFDTDPLFPSGLKNVEVSGGIVVMLLDHIDVQINSNSGQCWQGEVAVVGKYFWMPTD